jgi:hypothetical protein
MKRMSLIFLAVLWALFPMAQQGRSQEPVNKELVKMGQGARTKMIIGTVYYASLYVPAELKDKSAADIINAEKPMSVILQVDTGMLTRDRFVSAIREGFEKAASSGFPTDQVDRFLGYFGSVEIKKGDFVGLNYDPGTGLTASLTPQGGTAKVLGSVTGLPFKKALYAIWLGTDPVQDSTKKGMLGQKK